MFLKSQNERFLPAKDIETKGLVEETLNVSLTAAYVTSKNVTIEAHDYSP